MGNITSKDGTAQGVAKVRHWESLFPPEQRLYHDPYAYAMYPGSIAQKWLGPNLVDGIYRWMGMGGFSEMISIRTKWLDDRIMNAVNNKGGARQLVILGAGYDTRGFRLDLWRGDNNPDFASVIEVDQPEVQEKKLSNLRWLAKREESEQSTTISNRMNSKKVQFLPVNFNTDDLQQKLASHEGFKSNVCSVITLEGVTQYIPKEATADTLKKLKGIVAQGSTLLITYVDRKKCFDDDDDATNTESTLPKPIRMVRYLAGKVGEPWISGWTSAEFGEFLEDCGYEVVSDTTQEDYNETYLKDVGRQLEEKDLLSMERFVVAKAKV